MKKIVEILHIKEMEEHEFSVTRENCTCNMLLNQN